MKRSQWPLPWRAAMGSRWVSSFTGNDATNDGNGGNGYVVLSEVMYVGATSCSALPTGTTCTNKNEYVYVQRLDLATNRSNSTAFKCRARSAIRAGRQPIGVGTFKTT